MPLKQYNLKVFQKWSWERNEFSIFGYKAGDIIYLKFFIYCRDDLVGFGRKSVFFILIYKFQKIFYGLDSFHF